MSVSLFFSTHILKLCINTSLLLLLKPTEQEEIEISLVKRGWFGSVTCSLEKSNYLKVLSDGQQEIKGREAVPNRAGGGRTSGPKP